MISWYHVSKENGVTLAHWYFLCDCLSRPDYLRLCPIVFLSLQPSLEHSASCEISLCFWPCLFPDYDFALWIDPCLFLIWILCHALLNCSNCMLLYKWLVAWPSVCVTLSNLHLKAWPTIKRSVTPKHIKRICRECLAVDYASMLFNWCSCLELWLQSCWGFPWQYCLVDTRGEGLPSSWRRSPPCLWDFWWQLTDRGNLKYWWSLR